MKSLPAFLFKLKVVLKTPSLLSLLVRRHVGYSLVGNRSEAVEATLTGLIIHEAGEIEKPQAWLYWCMNYSMLPSEYGCVVLGIPR